MPPRTARSQRCRNRPPLRRSAPGPPFAAGPRRSARLPAQPPSRSSAARPGSAPVPNVPTAAAAPQGPGLFSLRSRFQQPPPRTITLLRGLAEVSLPAPTPRDSGPIAARTCGLPSNQRRRGGVGGRPRAGSWLRGAQSSTRLRAFSRRFSGPPLRPRASGRPLCGVTRVKMGKVSENHS